jgi:transcriptional regulator with XRE-family HTH domain
MSADLFRSLDLADLGRNLHRLRKQRRLTQQQLAELVDVQQRVVSRWETGTVKPHLDHAVRLARVLEVSLDQLVFGEEAAAQPEFDVRNKRLKDLCRQVDQLRLDEQEVVCHVMDSLVRKERMRAIMADAVPSR